MSYGVSVKVEESVEIARPPDAVWEVVSDPVNDPRWCSKVKAVRRTGPATWNVVHKPVPLRPAAELSVQQILSEPGSRLKLREEDDAAVFDVEYRLEPTAAGTRFTQISTFEWKKLPGPLHGFFARGVRRDVRGQLRRLKGLLEGA